MTELYILLFVGIFFLFVFALEFAARTTNPGNGADSLAKLAQFVPLQAVCFAGPELLFDDRDYRWLQSHQALSGTARRHWRDRRNLVLRWLKLLHQDILSLWAFRRMLGRFGVSKSAGEELRVLGDILFGLAWVYFLRLAVLISGPYAVIGLFKRAHRIVETFSHSCAGHLGRVPPSRWSELENLCAARFRSNAAY